MSDLSYDGPEIQFWHLYSTDDLQPLSHTIHGVLTRVIHNTAQGDSIRRLANLVYLSSNI